MLRKKHSSKRNNKRQTSTTKSQEANCAQASIEALEPRLLLSFDYFINPIATSTTVQGHDIGMALSIDSLSSGSGNNPSVYYTLDESAGVAAADGAVWDDYWATSNDTGVVSGHDPSRVTGKWGNAFHFNGTSSQYVQIANSTDVSPDDNTPQQGNVFGASAVAWVKSDNANWNSSNSFIYKDNAFVLGGVSGSKTVRFGVYVGGAWQYASWTPSGTFDITQWHHFAGTYDHSNIRLYVDGLLVSTAALTGNVGQSSAPVYVGRDSGTNYFQGSIDEVAIYKGVTWADTIAAMAGATRFVRYVPPTGSYADISEFQIWGKTTPDGNPQNLSVADPRGTIRINAHLGYLSASANVPQMAEDGDFNTYYESTDPDNGWVSRNVEQYDANGAAINPVIITSIKYAPRTNYGSRMVGGHFDASISQEFTHDVVALTGNITTAPANGVLTDAGTLLSPIVSLPHMTVTDNHILYLPLTITPSSAYITTNIPTVFDVRNIGCFNGTQGTASYPYTISVPSNTPAGAYYVDIAGGTVDGHQHTVRVNFNVVAAPSGLPAAQFGNVSYAPVATAYNDTNPQLTEADITTWENSWATMAQSLMTTTSVIGNPDWMYDGVRDFSQIADYTGNSYWLSGADPMGAQGMINMLVLYRDSFTLPYNGNQQLHEYFPYTRGLLDHYYRTSDPVEKAQDILAIQEIYDNWFPPNSAVMYGMRPAFFNVEIALDAIKVGATTGAGMGSTQRLGLAVDDVLSMFDQLFVQKKVLSPDAYFGHVMQPWWIGFCSESLINYYDYTVAQGTPDTRIPGAIRTAANWLMGQTAGLNNAWNETNDPANHGYWQLLAFRGPDFTVDPRNLNSVSNPYPNPMLDELTPSAPMNENLMVTAPMFAWLYKMYGENSVGSDGVNSSQYRIWGDKLFHWGTVFTGQLDPNGNQNRGKMTNQNWYWSARYLQYRMNNSWGAGDTTAPTITVAPVNGGLAPGATYIAWQTNERIATTVQYGTTPTYDGSWITKTIKDDWGDILVNKHRVELTGLTQGQQYYYRIKSTDSSGNTAYSSYYNFVQGAAAAPSGLAMSYASPYSVALTWAGVADISGYKIESSPDNSTWKEVATTTGTATTYTVDNLSANTLYYWRVKSYSSVNTSGASNVVSGTQPVDAPSVYEGFEYTNNQNLNGQNGGTGWSEAWQADTGSWKPVIGSGSLPLPGGANNLDSRGNNVHFADIGGGWAQRHTTASYGQAGTSLWVGFAFTPGDTLYQDLMILDAGAQSLKIGSTVGSNGLELYVTIPTYLFQETTSQISAGASVFVVANITYGATTDNIKLYRDPTPGNLAAPDPSTKVLDINVNASLLSTFNLVDFYLGGGVTRGASWDEIRLGYTYGSVAPSIVFPKAPTSLSATPVSSTQVNLGWTDPSNNETGYKIWYSTDNRFWSLKGTVASPNQTSYSATGLNPGTTYYFRVSEYNTSGDSYMSNTASASTTGTALPTVSVMAQDVGAREAGSDPGVFRISRTGSTGSALTVNYAMSGLANNTAGVDYNMSGTWGTATIGAGSAYVDVTLTPIDDTVVGEGPEGATLTISASANYAVDPLLASNTVVIGDSDLPTISVTATDPTASEVGPDTGTYRITRDGVTTNPLTVYYYMSGTAYDGNVFSNDYTPLGAYFPATIPAGQSYVDVTITPTADSVVQGQEQAILNIRLNPLYTVSPSNPNATVTIEDADNGGLPTVYVTVVDMNAYENTGNQAVFRFTRTGSTVAALPISYFLCNPPLSMPSSDASAATDFQSTDFQSLGTITIPAGSASVDVSLTPISDGITEGSESVVLIFNSVAGSYTANVRNMATVWIGDVDPGTGLPTVSVAAQDANASETGPDTGTYRISRTGATTSALTVYYAMSGQATDTSDYSHLSGTATIASGSSYVDVTLTPVDDTVIGEGSETAVLTISTNANYTVGGSPATVNIADNDLPTVSVSATDEMASETGPDAGIIRISRDGLTVNALTVLYSMSGTASNTSGTDYNLSGTWGTATIGAGASYVDVTLTPVDDALAESTETAILTISANASYSIVGVPATVNIADNDTLAGLFAYEGFNYSTGALNGDNGGTGWSNAWLSYSTATVGAGSLVGQSPANTLQNLGNKLYWDESGAQGGYAQRNLSTTIGADGTSIWVSFVYTATNTSSIDFGDLRIGNYGGNIGVTGTANGGYGSSFGANTFGTTSLWVANITYSGTYDNVKLYKNPTPGAASPESGSEVTPTGGYNIPTINIGTGTLIDFYVPMIAESPSFDEIRMGYSYQDVSPALPTVTVIAQDSSASETGPDAGTFRINRTGATTNALPVYYSMGGQASSSSGTDYNLSGTWGTATIAAGNSYVDVTLTPVNDTVVEGSETAVLTISSNAGYFIGAPGSNTVNIADNDLATISVSATDASASETGPGTGTFRISSSVAMPYTLTVYYTMSGTASTVPGTDYNLTGTLGTATIASGNSYVDVTLTPVDDAIIEATETGTLTISSNANYTVGGSPATVNIADDDLATVSVSATDASASETGPDAGTFHISSSVAMPYALTVYYSMSGTASNTAGVDYNLSGTWGTATIASGSSYVDVTLTPVDDTSVEGAETAILTISTNAAYTVGSPSNDTVSIADNDSTPPAAPTALWVWDDTTTTRIRLAWTDNSSDETGFKIDQATNSSFSGATTYTVGSNVVTYDATGLTAGTAYWFRVYAYSAGGNSNYTNVLNLSTDSGTATKFAPGGSITIIHYGTPWDANHSWDKAFNEACADEMLTQEASGGWVGLDLGTASQITEVKFAGGSRMNGGKFQGSNTSDFSSGVVDLFTIPSDPNFGWNTQASSDSGAYRYVRYLSPANGYTDLGEIQFLGTTAILPTVTVSATDNAASETGPGTGTYRISRTGATTSALTVLYTMGGTATDTSDYSHLNGTATIAAGSSYVDVTLTPVDDLFVEGSETAVLTISSNANYTIGGSPATVNIADNDFATISVSATDASASETGPDAGIFRINSSVTMPYTLTVYYTISGTAIDTSDYSHLSGTATIAAGSSYVDVTLTPVDDTLVEGTETAILTISGDSNYISGGTPATVYIADNDTGLFAYEGFDYSTGALNGNNGGIGWSGGWVSYFTATVGAGSLTPQSPANVLQSRGNKMYWDESGGQGGYAERNLTSTIGADGTSIWLSFVYTATTTSQINFGDLRIGNSGGNMTIWGYANGGYGSSFGPNAAGTTSLWAANVSYGSVYDNVKLYKNPVPGAVSPDPSTLIADFNIPTANILTSNLISFYIPMITESPSFDEIRMGYSYQDVTPDPTVSISASAPSAAEGGSNGTFTVSRGTATEGDLTVNYTAAGTATNGTDYTSLPGSVVIPNGQSSATITVAVTNDTLAELKEYVDLTVTSGNYYIGSSNTATVSIADNDTVSVTANPIAYWRLDEKTGTSATDTAAGGATGDTGTLNGSPTWIAAKIDNGLTLNGTSQYVQVANSNDLNMTSNQFSASMWVKSGATTWNSTQTFVSKGNKFKFGGVSGGKNIQFSLYISGAWKNLTYTNSGDISTNWHLYTATYDGSNMRIWVDGSNVATLAQTGNIASDTSVMYIGRISSSYLNGSMDEVRIYNSCLNSTDISALYNQANPSVTGLTVSGTHGASYSVQGGNLNTGITQYGDVTKNFTTVPAKYLGSTWIKTAQADNSIAGVRDFLTFTVNTAVTVYVMYDDAIATKPTWLTSQFTDTGDNIVTQQGTFSLYKTTLSAGTFSLGSNLDSGTTTYGMYNVLIVPVV